MDYLSYRKRRFAGFKLWTIILFSIVALLGLALLINSIATSSEMNSYTGTGGTLLKQIWVLELFVGILILVSAAASFIALFFNKVKIAVDFVSEAIIIWPLANVIEVILLVNFMRASLFDLAPLAIIIVTLCFISTILGIIASIRKIDEDIRKKIGVASFLVGAFGILLCFFQGSLGTMAIIVNIFYILIAVMAAVYNIRYIHDFEYYFDFFVELSNSEKSKALSTNNNPVAFNNTANKTVENRLDELKALYEKGYITQEQYNLKKDKIIDEI